MTVPSIKSSSQKSNPQDSQNVVSHISGGEMRSTQNMILHGLYYSLYGFVKYLSFPFFNYPRFWVIRLFSSTIRSPSISDGVTIAFPWRVHIGPRSSLNQGVIIDGTGGVRIGSGVRVAPYACFYTADHDYRDPDTFIVDQGFLLEEIIVEDDVWIGSGVKIMKGVTIGKGSVIGSGAVVTKSIPPYSIAVGIPCKVVQSRKPNNS